MEKKEVKNEVPAPETARGKEPEKTGKGKKELTRSRYSNERRCWFTRLWDWYSWGLCT